MPPLSLPVIGTPQPAISLEQVNWNAADGYSVVWVTGHRPKKIERHKLEGVYVPCLGNWHERLPRYAALCVNTLLAPWRESQRLERLAYHPAVLDDGTPDPFGAPPPSISGAPTFVIGMAVGWDQAVAQACVQLGLPFVAYVPCEGQEQHWPRKVQHTYHQLLKQAVEVLVVSSGKYAPWKMHVRDRRMVDDAQEQAQLEGKPCLGLAFWNGASGGGTDATIQYALTKQQTVLNAWPTWAQVVYPSPVS